MSSVLVSQTNSKNTDPEGLGISFEDIATGGIFGGAGLAIKNLLGRKSCSGEDKERRNQIAQAIDQLLTPSEKRNLVRGMESDVAPTGRDMAWFFMGGKDCFHKNVTPGDQRFLDRLPVVLERKAAVKQAEQEARRQAEQTSPPETDSKVSGPVSQVQTEGQQQSPQSAAQAAGVGSGFDIDPMALWIGGTLLVGGLSVIALQNRNEKRN